MIRLTVWSRDFQRRGQILAPLEVRFTPRWNAASSLIVKVDPSDRRVEDLRTEVCRIVAEYLPAGGLPVVRSGVVAGLSGGSGELEVSVRDDWADLMLGVLGWPNPPGGVGQQGDDGAYWALRAPAETVALEAIYANAARLGIPLAMDPTQGRGALVDASLRFHPLADRLLPAVDAAGIGVHIVQDEAVRRVVVEVPRVRDRVLTEESGAVTSGTWSTSAPSVTRVLVGCGGEGTARVLRQYIDTAREAVWPLREAFVDARDISTDDPELDVKAQARADKALLEGAATSSVAAALAETPRFAFGRTYRLGDRVSLRLRDSPVITDVVREVEIVWTAEAGLTVTPKVGLWSDSPDVQMARTVARIEREQRDRRTV